MRNTDCSSALSKATVGSDFASTTNQQASTLLLKIQDISPYRDTLHLQEQMEARRQSQSLFDEIVYLSPAFPMFHQDSQPIIFGMRLRNEDKLSMEAITVFNSLIARGVDWVHFVKCMALPSAYRNYQVSSGIFPFKCKCQRRGRRPSTQTNWSRAGVLVRFGGTTSLHV